MGLAVLSIWDGTKAVDIEIEWKKGYDEDAKLKVPVRFRGAWKEAAEILRSDGDTIAPYANLPIEIPTKNINKSATGAYAIAQEIWGREMGWRVWPPYPEAEEERQDVRQ